MIKYLLTIALLSACDLSVSPEERGIEVDHSIHKVYNQDKAMLLFEGMVEDFYDVKIPNRWNDTTVWWTTTTCPYNDNPAVIYDGECYFGRMWSCHEMYVALPEEGKTCGSALLHEFGHCLMMMHVAGNNFGDANHVTEIWDIVEEANQIACSRGW